jgi:AhpD family alkylhydroperoxidase
MKEDAAEFLESWQQNVERMKKLHPDAVKGFGALFQATMKDGVLTAKQKELIALGIAVAQHCEPCILLHVDKGLMAGNTPAEIIEAAGVAVMMGGGPAVTHLPVVIEALDALDAPQASADR